MVPVNNTTMEGELLAWLPSGSTCDTRRIARSEGLLTAETMPAYSKTALTLAEGFAGADLDLIVYGCTAAGFISGPRADSALAQSLANVTGKPVVTTASSMVTSLQSVAAKTIALVTPYQDDVNRRLISFLEESGILVARLASFRAADVHALGRITAHQVEVLARETMSDECDAMFIACSQLPTLTILERLELEFGRPTTSSIQATAEAAIRVVP